MRRLYLVLLFVAVPATARAQEAKDKPVLVLDAGGHTGRIWDVMFTPSGQELFSVSYDKTVRQWDLSSGSPARTWRPPIGAGNDGRLVCGSLSPDGKTLAVGGTGVRRSRNVIYLISLATGRVVQILRGHTAPLNCVAFSPGGKQLASSANDGTGRLWDLTSGECVQVLRGHTGQNVNSIAYSPDGELVATVSVSEVRLWSSQTGALRNTLRQPSVTWVAFAPNASALAAADGNAICLWTPDGKFLRQIDTGGQVIFVQFAGDSRKLFFAGRRSGLIDLTSSRVQTLTRDEMTGGALTRDGKRAATVDATGGIFLWNTTDGVLVQRLAGKSQPLGAVGWSADGRTVAYGAAGPATPAANPTFPLTRAFRVADVELGPLGGVKSSEPVTRRGDLSLVRKTFFHVAVKRPGQPDRELKPPDLGTGDPVARCFTLLDEDRAVVGDGNGRLYLFDTEEGRLLREYKGHVGEIWAVAPSPDGRYLLSASNDHTLRVWRLDQEAPLLSLFFAGEDWIAWTPEGYYAASAGGEKLMGWQVNDGPDRMAMFYAAEKFRKSLHRPDVIRRLLDAGSVEQALASADRERGRQSEPMEVGRVLPPRVRITTPSPGNRVDRDELTITAVAEGVGDHPVTAMRLLLDGRPYQGQAGLKKVREPRPGEVGESWVVRLTSGKHRLSVQADSAVSQATSDEVEVLRADGAAAEVDRPAVNLYVLAVGINAYPENLQLRCAAADAQAVAAAFEQSSRSLFQKVEVKVLTDTQATRRAVLDGLGWLRKEMTQRDVAVAFFAGHGAKDSEGSLYLLPSDVDPDNLLATAVPGEQIKKALAALPGRVLFLLDACHAGAAGGDRRDSGPLTDELVQDLATDDYGVVVMCAAMSREFSRESKKLGHGFFTQALVEGISGKGAKSVEGAVYLHHLDGYVTDRVKELTGGLQHPVTAKPTSIRSFPLSKP